MAWGGEERMGKWMEPLCGLELQSWLFNCGGAPQDELFPLLKFSSCQSDREGMRCGVCCVGFVFLIGQVTGVSQSVKPYG